MDDGWSKSIVVMMGLREPGGVVWPSVESFDFAERLASRLCSANLLAPDLVSVCGESVVMSWELEATRREVVVCGIGARFSVVRRDGVVSFEMQCAGDFPLDNVLYLWLDSWINCVS